MVKIIQEKNLIKVGKEPVVILPLKKWEEIKELLEEWEETIRFNQAVSDPKNKKLISFGEIKRKLNLP